MLTLAVPDQEKCADPRAENTASLWERFMAACSRSFELLAESKSRFPLDM